MRVLMVSQFFAPVIGGEERMVETMSVELVRRGHSVAVATLQTGDLPARETRDGVRVYRIGGAAQRVAWLYRDRERPHAPPVPDPLAARDLMGVVRLEEPDVIHGHNWLAQSMMPLRRLTRRPLALSLHDYSLVCPTRRLVRSGSPCDGPGLSRCVRCAAGHYGRVKGPPVALAARAGRALALSQVDMFLPVSNAVARRSGLWQSAATWRVLPNFLPTEPANGNGRPAGLPDDGFTLYVGDLTADKGLDVLLEAHAALPDAPPLVLIGRRLAHRELPPNVVALGDRPHAEVLDAWRRCGVAVAPSVTEEAFGLAALEAMAAGRPVVASAHGGLAEVIADGASGLLVRPGDPVALSRVLARLHADPELRARLGRGARRRAERFTAAAVMPRLEAAYRDLVAAGSPER